MYVHCYVVQDVAEAVCRTNDSSAYVLTTERWTLIADQIVRESQVSRDVDNCLRSKTLIPTEQKFLLAHLYSFILLTSHVFEQCLNPPLQDTRESEEGKQARRLFCATSTRFGQLVVV